MSHDKYLENLRFFLFGIGSIIGFIWWILLLFEGEILIFIIFPIIYAIGLAIVVVITSPIVLWSYYLSCFLIDKLSGLINKK